MKLTGLLKKKEDQVAANENQMDMSLEGMSELSEEELDHVVGGRMLASLYAQAYDSISKSGIAVALKEKAYRELDNMRASGTNYTPTDVAEMLKKRGITIK